MSDRKADPRSPGGRSWADLRLAALQLVEEARSARAPAVEVLLRRRTRRVLEGPGPVVGPLVDTRVHVRLTDGAGRVGRAAGSWHEVDAVLAGARQALDAAAPVDGEWTPPRIDAPDRGLGVDDPRLARLEDDARHEVITLNREGAHTAAPGLRVEGLSYYEEHEERAFAATSSAAATERSTRVSLRGALVDPESGLAVDGVLASRNFAEVASIPLGVELARRLVALGRPAPLPGGTPPLVIEQRAVARLLEALAPAFALEAVASGASYLSGRSGRAVAHARLHLYDDGLRMGGLGTRGFDDRGVPPMVVPLIREGVCGGFYQGPRIAAQADARPTGHARHDDALWPGNLVVRPGNRTRNMIFPELGAFLLIDDVLDVSGIDPRSGRVSAPVRVLVLQGTAVVGSPGVCRLETTADALLMGLRELASDQQRHGLVDTPTWVVEGVPLTAA